MSRRESRLEGGNRRGVALIVVLGFLSLLIVVAVFFLTQARTERLASDATMEGQRGRQLVRTALHAAMNDYGVALAGAQRVMPIAPAEAMCVSVPPTGLSGMGGRTIGEDGVDLLAGEVTDWIPRRYFDPPHDAPTAVNRDAQWILVREDPAAQSRILGRYAYVCFDMSGGIDANLIALEEEVAGNDGRAAARRVRRSVRQVPMRLLSETVDAGEFKRLRRGWKGFDSQYALIRLTDGEGNSGNTPPTAEKWREERKEIYGAGLASNLVSDLTPFSLSAWRGGRYRSGPNTWSPYVLCDDGTDWPAALEPISSQFAAGWTHWIGDALYDYTHADRTPRGTDYPSPKNVPMFNEVVATYEVEETPGGDGTSAYKLKLNLTFEFWYPFPSADNVSAASFDLSAPTVGGGPAITGPDQLWFRILPVAGEAGFIPLKLGAASPSPSALAVAATYNGGRPYLPGNPAHFTYEFPVEPLAGTGPLPTGLTLQIQGLKVLRPVYLTAGGAPADMLPKDLSFPGAALAAAQKKTVAKAATDPRLNHDAALQWVEESPSLGELNGWDAAAQEKFRAEGTNLYCRNAPMQTPAELGFISAGKEWETIDLCTEDAADAMANLVADTNLFVSWSANGVFYTNGTINPNTRSSNVLASAFIDLATHEVPNTPTNLAKASPINAETAQLLAAQILDETKDGKISSLFQAGSDWARVPAMRKGGALSKLGLNNNQRESLIRNTWGLFSPNNSLFTVVVIAQAIKEGPDAVGLWGSDDQITGERRAVALVWRDPFRTGENLHHEMFVRMFRYLND